jgi:hypothetical protein
VDVDAGGLGVGGHAGIISRVPFLGFSYDEDATRAVVEYRYSTLLVVINHAFFMVPEHVHRWLCALAKRAH